MSIKSILLGAVAISTALSGVMLPVLSASAEEGHRRPAAEQSRGEARPVMRAEAMRRETTESPRQERVEVRRAADARQDHTERAPTHPGKGHSTGPVPQPTHVKAPTHPRKPGETVIVDRTVIDEGFGPFWPVGPAVVLEDAAIASVFGWQPTETVVETVPLADFGECHYHVVTDRVTGAEKVGVWIDGKEVIAGSKHAIEQVLTNCTAESTPASTFAQVVDGFYPELGGYNLVTTGPGIYAPEIIRENNIERVTYFARDKANETVKVHASWGPKQAVQVKTEKI
ncbi:hypothetical protein [Paracoccus aminophilus]|uniref:Uncharacterized protein n=1 Tax=Paracoccus aminophilus JCM 7686 TaxID=1367847 RepID=S5XVI9_PARAH|nr:hypothetical protein [Paracoccus aminophilus]AGT09282.1 hypothetical protein JCM7686_2203 [Paracoccus aminophilus JCM 7686]